MAESDDEMEELLPPLPPTEEVVVPSAEDAKLSSLDNPDVVTKYKEAAKIAQAALIDIAAKVGWHSLFCFPFVFSDSRPCGSCRDVEIVKNESHMISFFLTSFLSLRSA